MSESESMTMVERVARALCPERSDPNGCRECLLDFISGQSTERKQCLAMYEAQARDAIEAMREPTGEMLATTAKERGFVNQLGAKLVWFSMIDAALADTPSTLEE